MDGRISIERERSGYSVRATDPAIAKANKQSGSSWRDPCVEYGFATKEEVIAFVTKAIDIALPLDPYTSEFDKLAKEAKDND